MKRLALFNLPACPSTEEMFHARSGESFPAFVRTDSPEE